MLKLPGVHPEQSSIQSTPYSLPPLANYSSGSDPDQLAALLSSPRGVCQGSCQVQIERRMPFLFQCSATQSKKIIVASSYYEGDFRISRQGTSDKIHLFLPMNGGASFECRGESTPSIPGHGTILEGARTTSAMKLEGPRRHLALIFDRESIRQKIASMLDRTIVGDLQILPKIDLTQGHGSVVAGLAIELYRCLSADSQRLRSGYSVNSIQESLEYLLIEGCSHKYSYELLRNSPSPSPKHVKKAIEYMESNISNPISLQDVASASNVSIRALQQGFRNFRNINPMSYLRDLRLTAVHSELSSSDRSILVSDVALKWGFTHLGRFAADYRKRYGYLPAQTPKRAR